VEAQAIQAKRTAFKESKLHPKPPMQSYSEEGEASANGEGIRAAIDDASFELLQRHELCDGERFYCVRRRCTGSLMYYSFAEGDL
jgi:hypothetical protein